MKRLFLFAAALAALALVDVTVATVHALCVSDEALCDTDADCAERFGGDGGPAPAPDSCVVEVLTSDVRCELFSRGCW